MAAHGQPDAGLVAGLPAEAWAQCLALLPLEALLPGRLAPWQPLLRVGLAVFLAELPARRQHAIWRTQLALTGADSGARLLALCQACPTLHKLAQVVARDPALPPSLARALQALESLPGTLTLSAARRALTRCYPGAVPGQIIGPALAQASVGVVFPAHMAGAQVESARGAPHPAAPTAVCKMLKPGIHARLAEEFRALAQVAHTLDTVGAQQGLPPLPYQATLDEVQALLRAEVDLSQEQSHLQAAGRALGDCSQLAVPRVWPGSVPSVTWMSYLPGTQLLGADHQAADPMAAPGNDTLAIALVHGVLALPFWSDQPGAPFHADPHAGNLLHMPDGRLGLLDWSLSVTLHKAEREAVLQLMLAGLLRQPLTMEHALSRLLQRPPIPAWTAVIQASLQDGYGAALPGLSWALGLLDRLLLCDARPVAGHWLLLRKAMHSWRHVVQQLAPGLDPDGVFLAEGLRQAARDWPARCWRAPWDRAGSSHVSSLDLGLLCFQVPDLP